MTLLSHSRVTVLGLCSFLISLVGLALALPTQAAGWAPLISGTSERLYDIELIPAGEYINGLIVGNKVISRSSDSGKTWSLVNAGGASLRDASFAPFTYTVWMVGESGTVYKSVDSGQSYVVQTANAGLQAFTLYGVHAANDTTAWLVGSAGKIAKTTNGGATWPQQSSGTGNDLYAVFFIDANTGWAVGENGVILRTVNGGTNWNAQTSGTTEPLYAVHFTDVARGFAVGRNRTILKTTNGGATWVAINAGAVGLNIGLRSVHMLNPSVIMISGDSGTLIESADAGVQWTAMPVNTTQTLHGVKYSTDANDRFTVSGNGTIYRYDSYEPGVTDIPQRFVPVNPTNEATPMFYWTAAEDNQTSVASYEVQTDGELWQNIGNATTYKVTPALAEGQHTFAVRAKDAAGNVGQAMNAAPFTVDLTPPTIGAPSPLTATPGIATTFFVTTQDNLANQMSLCTLFVNGSAQGSMMLNSGSASRQHTFNAGGAYLVKVTCNDGANNTGESQSVTVNVSSGTPSPAATTPSSNTSNISLSPVSLAADGSASSLVTVTVKNAGGTALTGKTVSLSSSRPSFDTIIAVSPTTNSSGQATFTVKSSVSGNSTITSSADGITLANAVLTFTQSPPPPPSSCPYAIGLLIKLPDDGNIATQSDSAVYYYGKDCKRHAFPNDKVYFSWYSNFNGVGVVSSQTLASMTLGSNVTYRPGVKMVKFTTVNRVYAVSKNGLLRWVKNEAVATALYGSNWNTKVDDISDAFYTNYLFGADINSTSDYSLGAEMQAAQTINDNL